jgi:hypothetical protein
MQGKRHDLAEDEYTLSPGEYGKSPDGKWFCHVPAGGFHVGSLGKHAVTEHEDGSITVSPSIVCDAQNGKTWHGWLERGIWREV